MRNTYAFVPTFPNCPVYVPTERYSFYMNFDKPISDPAFDTFELRIYRGDTMINNTFATLFKDIVSGFTYNIYSIFDFPEGIDNGYYQFVIWDTGADIEKCRSNFILVENDPTWYNNAPAVMYRNEQNFYGFNYENLVDFYNMFRLSLIETDYQYDLQKTQYRNATDQRLRNLKSYRFKYRKVESYYFDEDGHDAMSVMWEHDGIYIDGVKYVTKDAYSVTIDPINLQAKGGVNAFVDNPNYAYTFPINITPLPSPGGGSGGDTMARTVIRIDDGSQLTIAWQTDVKPGTTLTYAQIHGDNPIITEDDYVGGLWLPNDPPAYQKTVDPDTLKLTSITFTPQVVRSIFTII